MISSRSNGRAKISSMKFPISTEICFWTVSTYTHIHAHTHVHGKILFYYFARVKIKNFFRDSSPPLLTTSRHTAFASPRFLKFVPNVDEYLLASVDEGKRDSTFSRLIWASFESGIRRGTVAFSSQPDLEPDTERRSLADIYKLHQRRETEGANRLGVFQRFFNLFGSRPSSRKTSIASFTGTYV